jgi:hypothetical protein
MINLLKLISKIARCFHKTQSVELSDLINNSTATSFVATPDIGVTNASTKPEIKKLQKNYNPYDAIKKYNPYNNHSQYRNRKQCGHGE